MRQPKKRLISAKYRAVTEKQPMLRLFYSTCGCCSTEMLCPVSGMQCLAPSLSLPWGLGGLLHVGLSACPRETISSLAQAVKASLPLGKRRYWQILPSAQFVRNFPTDVPAASPPLCCSGWACISSASWPWNPGTLQPPTTSPQETPPPGNFKSLFHHPALLLPNNQGAYTL